MSKFQYDEFAKSCDVFMFLQENAKWMTFY